MLSRWFQIRLRGSRKVPEEEKVEFVLTDLWGPADWLKNQAKLFLKNLLEAFDWSLPFIILFSLTEGDRKVIVTTIDFCRERVVEKKRGLVTA